MSGFLDGALDVLAHVVVLGSIFSAAYVVDRYMARRRHEREWAGVRAHQAAARATGSAPRSCP